MKHVTTICCLLTLLASSADGFRADEREKLAPAEIISKHLAAVGGKDAIAKMKSRVAIGTAQKDGEAGVPVAIVSESPNRVSAIYQFRDFEWRLTYDGSKAIFRPALSRASSLIMHKYEDMLTTGTMFNSMSLFNVLTDGDREGVKFEAKGTKKVKGQLAYVVAMKRGKGSAVQLYFDAVTFMWVRTDYGNVRVTKDLGGFSNDVVSKDDETTYSFYVETSEFKDVDGVMLPFKLEVVATAPILRQKNVGTIITTITQYRHNIPIDAKMFQ